VSVGRSLWTRRARVLAAAVLLLLANLGFYLWYRGTAQERKDRMDARRVELTREVDAREREAAKLAAQRDRLLQVSSAIGEFYGKRVGPARDTLAPVVSEIHLLLARAGISPTQITYATLPLHDLPLSEMVVQFAFRNDYARFKQLLQSIETGRRWIVVRDVGLQRDPELPGGVQVRMSLVTYFGGEEPASARALLRPLRGTR